MMLKVLTSCMSNAMYPAAKASFAKITQRALRNEDLLDAPTRRGQAPHLAVVPPYEARARVRHSVMQSRRWFAFSLPGRLLGTASSRQGCRLPSRLPAASPHRRLPHVSSRNKRRIRTRCSYTNLPLRALANIIYAGVPRQRGKLCRTQ